MYQSKEEMLLMFSCDYVTSACVGGYVKIKFVCLLTEMMVQLPKTGKWNIFAFLKQKITSCIESFCIFHVQGKIYTILYLKV